MSLKKFKLDMKSNNSRSEHSMPVFLNGTYINSVFVSSEIKTPMPIPTIKQSPIAAFYSNKSYEIKNRKKGPSIDPIPLPW